MFYKDYKYKDIDGNEQTIRLLPLPVKYLPDLWDIQVKLTPKSITPEERAVYKKLDNMKEGDVLTEEEVELIFKKEREFASQIGKEDIKVLAEFCEATLKKSKKGMSEEEIEYVISNYFFELYPLILSLNFKK